MERVQPDPLQVNTRWQIPRGSPAYISSHAQIQIDTTHHCPWYLAQRDFKTFQRYLMHEIQRQCYRAAKSEQPSGTYGYLTSGVEAMERGWLESDMAITLDYYIFEQMEPPAVPYPSRALAALTALSRLVFVRARLEGNRMQVWARSAWAEGPGNPPRTGQIAVTPIRNGRVQVLYLEDASEEVTGPALNENGTVAGRKSCS